MAETHMTDSFKARTTLNVNGKPHTIWSFATLPAEKVARLPYSLKILLENLLRFEDGVNVTQPGHRGAAGLGRQGRAQLRNLLHAGARDHAGLHRRALRGGPRRHARSHRAVSAAIPEKVNPLAPAELVIDHSVQVDEYGTAQALADNNRIEFERNGERYSFLRWGQSAFREFQAWCRPTPASCTR